MKNVIVGLLGLAVITASVIYYLEKEEIQPCGYDKSLIVSTFQDWLTDAIAEKDKRIKNNPLQVMDVVAVMEYNKIPEVMGTVLYDDLKDSRVCKATLLVDFTPNGEKRNIEEINVRFQKTLTSPNEEGERGLYTAVSGYDVNRMEEQCIALFKKHHKNN